MTDSNKPFRPFKILGTKLKYIRENQQKTLEEVSGAVEIDISVLSEIENGIRRPSEDILLLLISLFNVHEDEALNLWQIAGFDKRDANVHILREDGFSHKPAMMIIPFDGRVVYTDMVHVVVNNYGVVMNFMQGSGANGQPAAIARVGMSKEHALSVLEVLQKTLTQSEPAQLPAQTQNPEAA